MTIKCGDLVRDTHSLFEGICFSRTEYVSGCVRICLQPRVGKDGKLPEVQHFDEPTCVVIKTSAVKAMPTKNGGPRPAPQHHKAPPR